MAETIDCTRAGKRLYMAITSIPDKQALTRGRAEFAAMNERLMAAEALAARLNEERAELGRRETALQQQVTSILDETSALARQSEDLGLQLEGLRGERLRLETRQRELEQEWDAARTRVTQMEDHLRMGRQSLQELREQRSHADARGPSHSWPGRLLRGCAVREVPAATGGPSAGGLPFASRACGRRPIPARVLAGGFPGAAFRRADLRAAGRGLRFAWQGH